MMGAAGFALMHYVDVSLEDQPGVRMELPGRIASWEGREVRYCHAADCREPVYADEMDFGQTVCPSCGAPLFSMSYEEWDALPKDTEFVKSQYSLAEGAPPLFVAIVLSGRDRESIHRPERCLVGQGLTITRRSVIPVPLPGGRAIRMMVIEYQREIPGPGETRRIHYGYYGYWFIGAGRETHSHWTRAFWLAWDRVIHSVAHKWAYVSISGTRDPERPDYLDTLRDFAAGLRGHIVL